VRRVRTSRRNQSGFSLVEVVIAMLLLAIIAVALLPPLVNGIRFSAEQSVTATATRHLNSLVEEARASPTCTSLIGVAAPQDVTGSGGAVLFRSSGAVGACSSATPETTVSLDLIATSPSGRVLATAEALVFVP